jgi:hypothetical protein
VTTIKKWANQHNVDSPIFLFRSGYPLYFRSQLLSLTRKKKENRKKIEEKVAITYVIARNEAISLELSTQSYHLLAGNDKSGNKKRAF